MVNLIKELEYNFHYWSFYSNKFFNTSHDKINDSMKQMKTIHEYYLVQLNLIHIWNIDPDV